MYTVIYVLLYQYIFHFIITLLEARFRLQIGVQQYT